MNDLNYKPSKFNILIKYDDHMYLLYNTLSKAILAMDLEEKEQIESFLKNYRLNNTKNIINKSALKMLKEGKFIINSNIDELNSLNIIRKYTQMSFKDNFTITIALNSTCNFNCTYCFENGYRNHTMDTKMLDSTIDYIKRNIKGRESLSIVWYGGEPLLEIDKIKTVYESISKDFSENFHYTSSMITNGYLLNAKNSKILKEINVKTLQITLDGDRETHDKRRFLKNGKGTYDIIVDNIKNYSKDFNISLRVNLDKNNINDYKTIYDIFKNYPNVSVYTAPVDAINDNYSKNSCLSVEEFSKIERNCFKYNSGISIPELNLTCTANEYDGVIIGPDGYLYKCWNHLGIQDFIVGDIDTGFYYNKTYKDFILDEKLDEKCYKCSILPLCYGGCTDKRLRENKSTCLSLKYNVIDRIKLYSMNKFKYI